MAVGDIPTISTEGGFELITPSDAGKVLTSNGVGVEPTFETPSSGGSDDNLALAYAVAF